MFAIVEKRNHLAVHGLFDYLDHAQRHLETVIPEYVAKSYFDDKELTADDFEIIQNAHGTRSQGRAPRTASKRETP